MCAVTSRQQQAHETRQRILSSALELFHEKDIESATITEICGRAGVSNGNFYNYFESKAEILMDEYRIFDDYVRDEFSKLKFDSALYAVRELIHHQVAGAARIGPNLFSQILGLQLKRQGASVIEEDRFFHKHLRELLQRAISQGELAEGCDAEALMERILRLSRGLLFDWSMRRGTYDLVEKAMKDLDFLLSCS